MAWALIRIIIERMMYNLAIPAPKSPIRLAESLFSLSHCFLPSLPKHLSRDCFKLQPKACVPGNQTNRKNNKDTYSDPTARGTFPWLNEGSPSDLFPLAPLSLQTHRPPFCVPYGHQECFSSGPCNAVPLPGTHFSQSCGILLPLLQVQNYSITFTISRQIKLPHA